MQIGLEKDIKFLIGLRPVESYTALCELLQAYDSKAVFECANNLVQQGMIRMGSQGFELCEMQNAKQDTSTPVRTYDERSTAADDAQTQGNAALDAPVRIESDAPKPVEKPESVNDKSAVTTIEAAPEQRMESKSAPLPVSREGASAIEPKEIWFQKLSNASEGSLLASSSIKLLNLPEEIAQSLTEAGITTIADVVSRIDTLGKAMPLDSAVSVCQALLTYSGEPLKLNIGQDTKRQLHSISGSSSFTFDWLGVLGTTLSRDATTASLLKAVTKRNDDLPCKKDVALESLAAFPSDAKDTVSRLKNHLKSKGYPVFEDSFEAIMLPIIALGFEYGDYEEQREALAAGGNLIDDSPQTKDACFGMLRDQVLEQREKGDKSSSISVRWADAFIDAAKRIDSLECGCSFDPNTKRLTVQ